MHYDLALLSELCSEFELTHTAVAGKSVAIVLEPGTVLRFENYADEKDGGDDCLVGFEDPKSHSHGNLTLYARGQQLELNCLDAISGLVDGSVLVCELWKEQELQDRWLVHKDFIDEFAHLEPGEDIRVRRIQLDQSAQ